MKYFEIFGLKPILDIDLRLLKRKYFELSRSAHPDFFTKESVEKQMEAMETSSMINKAYNTLKDETKRIKYVLDSKALLPEDANLVMPPEFLMEMMDLHENIDAAKQRNSSSVIQQLQADIQNRSNLLRSSVQALFQADFTDYEAAQWESLRDYYLKLRYIQRLQTQLNSETEI